ncbi:hypothetical protein CALVIDRAFT_537319 [Calocera viscosa TUFC12733]|uniref:Uncharacterized protein n=1 Tax=Calocera viscosa (strain TUFC12733) TaxID=1330018 RepID=A0A167LXE4_CALVF|nr:hypothetical protein CALVIDRAFT_537319 [Calocera viscosa TUFC12733]
MITGVGGDGALQIALLSRFTALKHLSIEAMALRELSELSDGKSPSLDMPFLVELRLRCRTNEPLSDFLLFLGRGKFVGLTRLDLDLPSSVLHSWEARLVKRWCHSSTTLGLNY